MAYDLHSLKMNGLLLDMYRSENAMMEYIEINADTNATHCVIWLHGLGADGSDFVPIIEELNLPHTLNIKFIFPHAPIIPITINNGFAMRAWYDITSYALDKHIDEERIHDSARLIRELIANEEAKGLCAENIVLAGFSQGAVIALTAGLTYPKRLAGIMALSGYLPDTTKTLIKACDQQHKVPVFIAHGTDDPIVPYSLGKAAYIFLKEADFDTTWHSYSMPHAVCPNEIADISKWLQKVLR